MDDPLANLAKEPERREELLSMIVDDGFFVMMEGVRPQTEPQTPEELLGQIREEVKALSEGEMGRPFAYEYKGSTIFPIFMATRSIRSSSSMSAATISLRWRLW